MLSREIDLFKEEWRQCAACSAVAVLAALCGETAWAQASGLAIGPKPTHPGQSDAGDRVEPPRADVAPSSSSPGSTGSGGAIIELDASQPPRPETPSSRAAMATATGSKRTLTVGEVTTITLPSVTRIAMGNGRLVKATVVDGNQIVLLAEAAGDTTMHVWLRGGREFSYALHVQAQRHDGLLADLTDFVKDMPTLRIRTVGERIVLEGRYPDAAAAARVTKLAASFPQVLNLASDRPMDADPLQLERMVQLDLRVVEVKKSALEQLGVKWASTANGPSFATNALGYADTPWRPGSVTGFPPVTTTNPISGYFGLATQLTSALALLEQRGDAWTLAEPRLSCKSGGESKFVAGGEIPIPVAQGNGSIGVVYKQYGVVLEFKPVADGAGNIESGILIEVSEPDSRNSNAGYVAFTTNRTETQVAVKEGEPLVISGLLRQKVEKSSDGLPGLSRIPVLSYLFGSREVRTEQTELFLVVMPRVIAPDSAAARAGIDRAQALNEEASRSTGERLDRAASQSPLNPASAPSAARSEPRERLPFTISSP